VTADEVPDPQRLRVRFWNDGELRHDYSTSDMEHQVHTRLSLRLANIASRSTLGCRL
jgi:2-keto-4-pentenoate hydratase/2-oxohepta-3-ene-1,7-dioic acid hydratase in catechol pathway